MEARIDDEGEFDRGMGEEGWEEPEGGWAWQAPVVCHENEPQVVVRFRLLESRAERRGHGGPIKWEAQPVHHQNELRRKS